MKNAIVTGSGSHGPHIRNGEAIAICLAREGVRVGVLDADHERAARTVDRIVREGGQATAMQADVTNLEDCENALSDFLSEAGTPDILVNNVGVLGPRGTVLDIDGDEWDRAMNVNVKSIVNMGKVTLPLMIDNEGGCIVNIGSSAGLLAGHPDACYATSKAAVVHLTRVMAAHHGAQGVRVNCVVPGMVFSPMANVSEEDRERRRLSSLLETEGTPWDVANAVRYLVSDYATWVTGVVLPVDGGFTSAKTR